MEISFSLFILFKLKILIFDLEKIKKLNKRKIKAWLSNIGNKKLEILYGMIYFKKKRRRNYLWQKQQLKNTHLKFNYYNYLLLTNNKPKRKENNNKLIREIKEPPPL